MSVLQLETPEWALPLLEPSRYKGAWGGRGSGKSHMFAELMIEAHIIDQKRRSVCVREIQKSLNQSVKRLLETKIQAMNAGAYFEVQDAVIKSRKGDGAIIFQGMQNHTADSIKSLEGYDCAWVEEAQSLSQNSLDLLRPTIRKPGSELCFTWNPRQQSDPVDFLLRGPTPPKDATVIKVNFSDNPWFPRVSKTRWNTTSAAIQTNTGMSGWAAT
jgi:phage terminase large subunit